MSNEDRDGTVVEDETGQADSRDLAAAVADAVALMEHHRAELRAAFDELTALQREFRAEVLQASAQLGAVSDASPEPAEQPRGRRRRWRRS